MALRILTRCSQSMNGGDKQIQQYFKYLLVLDFESTCKRYEQIVPQEIIEFPCAAVSTTNWKVENVFHQYIKPKVHPILTPFCTELTGIIQDMVDDQPHFPHVFAQFCNWLDKHNYFKEGNDCAFVTCGDWDLKFMLPRQCKLENIELPVHFMKWVNLKGTFCDATDYYPRSLTDMLAHLNLTPVGRAHSGIDDVNNMISIIQALQSKYNVQFKINNMHYTITKHYMRNPNVPYVKHKLKSQ